jgi:hypothetical protein
MRRLVIINKVMKVTRQLLKVGRILLASAGHRKVLLIVESDAISKAKENKTDVLKVYLANPEVAMFIYQYGVLDAVNIPPVGGYDQIVSSNKSNINS